MLLLAACSSRPPLPTPTPIPKPPVPEPVSVRQLPAQWSDLPAWPGEHLLASWPAWQQSCVKIGKRPAWRAACAAAATLAPESDAQVQAFFEQYFSPWQITSSTGADDGLITGYYESSLRGSREPGPGRVPLYAVPDDMLNLDMAAVYPSLKGLRLRGRLDGKVVRPYWSRAEIEAGKLAATTPVLVWADNAVDAFFLQIQGSGRVQLEDGSWLRLGYADQNGHPYKSIGKWLVDQGEMTLDQASMQSIRAWGEAHPERLQEMLNQNPSYVFFRRLPEGNDGPIGALGVPLTGGASIAVDPKFTPLGAPVYLDTTYPNRRQSLQRLVMAQDTGGAIAGPVRADFFWGFGDEAAAQAGKMKQRGRMWLLWPQGSLPPAAETAAEPAATAPLASAP